MPGAAPHGRLPPPRRSSPPLKRGQEGPCSPRRAPSGPAHPAEGRLPLRRSRGGRRQLPACCFPSPRYQLPVEIRGAQGEEGIERFLHPLRHSLASVILRRLPPQPLEPPLLLLLLPPPARLHGGAAGRAGC